jgi:hypothetical protein
MAAPITTPSPSIRSGGIPVKRLAAGRRRGASPDGPSPSGAPRVVSTNASLLARPPPPAPRRLATPPVGRT